MKDGSEMFHWLKEKNNKEKYTSEYMEIIRNSVLISAIKFSLPIARLAHSHEAHDFSGYIGSIE